MMGVQNAMWSPLTQVRAVLVKLNGEKADPINGPAVTSLFFHHTATKKRLAVHVAAC